MGDYFKYAFGEIVLITIGILLALFIDDWNSNLQQENLKSQLLDELVEEIDYNETLLMDLDTNTAKQHLTFKDADSIFKYRAYAIMDGLDTAEIEQIMYGPDYKFTVFNLRTDVYQQLDESQVVNSLSPKLKSAIKRYYKLIERNEMYNNRSIEAMENAVLATKYGYFKLRYAYLNDSINYLKKPF